MQVLFKLMREKGGEREREIIKKKGDTYRDKLK
jgi:hypothetical protein